MVLHCVMAIIVWGPYGLTREPRKDKEHISHDTGEKKNTRKGLHYGSPLP